MTTDRDKCGLSSFLPMSCRGRAEAFARRLHSRLSSLGSSDSNGTVDENTWLATSENPVLSQPKQTDPTLYFDFGDLDSPGSPQEELLDGPELEKLINQDHLKLLHSTDCHCPLTTLTENNLNLYNSLKASSIDSDSSDQFYDSENDLNQPTTEEGTRKINGTDDVNDEISAEELYVTSSECTLPPCTSLSLQSDEFLTLSLRDEDSLSDCNSLLQHDNKEEEADNSPEDAETYSSSLTVEKNLTVECPGVVASLNECEQSEFNKESVPNNIDDDIDESEEVVIPRVRRCSSLKTGKTPPGTPGRKKIVRFADVLGLDLADVRTFLDEIPKIPNSAYNDLRDVDLNSSSVASDLSSSLKFHEVKVEKILVPLFQQPGGQPDFIERIREKQVCLENALVEDPVAMTITGTIRVKNLDFHKTVHIRYSLDSWQTFADVQAIYVENSCDGFSDKFSFLLFAHTVTVGQRLEFAIRFQCRGCQYWDNNNGANYCFQCLPATNTTASVPITDTDSWGASFY